MNRVFILVSYVLIVSPLWLFSQDTPLTLNDAIQQALSNNYGLKIISAQAQKEENNNTAGNAGMLPGVGITSGYSKSINNLNQKFINGLEVNRDNVGASNLNAAANLNWIIFDGMKMFYTKDKLEQRSEQAQVELRMAMENTVQAVILTYHSIVRNKQLLKATREELRLTEERQIIAERKLNNGSGSKFELLQARTELNRQKSKELSIKNEYDESVLILNQLLGRDPTIIFTTEDTVIISYRPALEELKSSIKENNPLLKGLRINNRIATLQLNETKAMRLPVISFNSQYNFIRSTSEAGFSLLNQQHGLQYGFSATLPLFSGFNNNRQIKNARLDVLTSQMQIDEAEQKIKTQLLTTWQSFMNSLEALKLEEENITSAKEMMMISQERYKVGSSNAIELQDAQRTFEEAMLRLADARYQAKLNETELKKLNGRLVQTSPVQN